MSLVAAVLYTEDAVVSASQPMVHFDRGSLKESDSTPSWYQCVL